jgi:hypothetical protein
MHRDNFNPTFTTYNIDTRIYFAFVWRSTLFWNLSTYIIQHKPIFLFTYISEVILCIQNYCCYCFNLFVSLVNYVLSERRGFSVSFFVARSEWRSRPLIREPYKKLILALSTLIFFSHSFHSMHMSCAVAHTQFFCASTSCFALVTSVESKAILNVNESRYSAREIGSLITTAHLY